MGYDLFNDIESEARKRLSEFPDGRHVAISLGDMEVTYPELLERAGGLSGVFRRLFRAERPRVALVGPDGPGYVASALGILGAGGVFVSAGKEISPDDFSGLLEKMSVDVAVVEEELARRLAPAYFEDGAAVTAFGEVYRVFVRSGAAPDFPGEEEFNSLNPAFARFSSGTTGARKGVALSHESIRDRTDAADSAFALSPGERVLWLMPMAHHFAATINLFLRRGCVIDVSSGGSSSESAERLRGGECSFVYATPWHYLEMARADTGAPRELPDSVRLLVSTAMALSPNVSELFEERFGRCLNQAYGIIECGIPCVNLEPERDGVFSVGKPVGGHEARTDAPDGISEGEVLLRGPGFFDAYLRPWIERASVLDSGWFRTGDIGVFSETGALSIVGRRKSLINFMGLKIFPEKVEPVLNALPGVRESRVFGENHPAYGEMPVAEIAPDNSASPPNTVELTRLCRERLSTHEIPQEFRIVRYIPKTPSGKVRR
jgi:long-chain acyl-CoA synthetase